MAESLIGLTREEYRDFNAMRAQLLARTGERRPIADPLSIDHEEHPTPEVYIARTPSGGILALSEGAITGTGSLAWVDDVPGQAICQIYKLNSSRAFNRVDGLTRTVFNLATALIPGNAWIIVQRDKFGAWFADSAQTVDVPCLDEWSITIPVRRCNGTTIIQSYLLYRFGPSDVGDPRCWRLFGPEVVDSFDTGECCRPCTMTGTGTTCAPTAAYNSLSTRFCLRLAGWVMNPAPSCNLSAGHETIQQLICQQMNALEIEVGDKVDAFGDQSYTVWDGATTISITGTSYTAKFSARVTFDVCRLRWTVGILLQVYYGGVRQAFLDFELISPAESFGSSLAGPTSGRPWAYSCCAGVLVITAGVCTATTGTGSGTGGGTTGQVWCVKIEQSGLPPGFGCAPPYGHPTYSCYTNGTGLGNFSAVGDTKCVVGGGGVAHLYTAVSGPYASIMDCTGACHA